MKPNRLPALLLIAFLGVLAAILVLVLRRDRTPVAAVFDLPTGKGFPVEVRLAGGEPYRFDAAPARVLPANAGVVDYVTRLVEPARVCAMPAQSWGFSRLTRSSGAASEEEDGWAQLPRFDGYTAEALLGHEPDLVIIHGWQSIETTALLSDQGVPVLEIPTPRTWAEVLRTLELLGRVLGAEARAAELLASLEQRREALEQRARHGPIAELSALSYSNLGAGGWAAGADTTADVLFALCGLRNAAAEHGVVGHGRLDIESMLLLDPDVIVVGAQASEDAAAESPTANYLFGESRLASLSALRERRTVVLPPRLYSTSSLELLDAAEALMDALEALY